MKRGLMLLVGLVLLLSGSAFAQTDRSKEVTALLNGLDSPSRAERINAAKLITQKGIVDPSLYEKVAGLLQTGYAADTDSDHVDEMAWLCKALAASGDTKYLGLLQEVAAQAPSSKLQRYAQQSVDLFAQYQERSRVLNATATWDSTLSAEDNRLVSMLNAADNNLRRDAAKTIVRNTPQAEKVYDNVASTLLAMVNSGVTDNLSIDTMAWLCKALAASGNQKYVTTLDQVVKTTSNSKLIKFASNASDALQ